MAPENEPLDLVFGDLNSVTEQVARQVIGWLAYTRVTNFRAAKTSSTTPTSSTICKHYFTPPTVDYLFCMDRPPDRPPGRPPPGYDDDPDDPFISVDPRDPNLSFTAPPNPANMRPPAGMSPNRTWHVITGGPGLGISHSWHITRAITHGISGAVHCSYGSWAEALAAYTEAYNAHAVHILVDRRTNRSRRRALTHASPGSSFSNPYIILSSAPNSPHHPSTQQTPTPAPGADRSHPFLMLSSPSTPFPSGHPQHPFYIGSSPVPTPHMHASPAAASPAPKDNGKGKDKGKASSTSGSTNRLHAIEEALSEGSPHTPRPFVSDRDVLRARLRALEATLNEYEERLGVASSPQTPTPANSSVESRLSALKAAMDLILTREAQQESRQGRQPGISHEAVRAAPEFGRNLHGTDPILPRSVVPAAVGSSTGPGTLAGNTDHPTASPSALRSPPTVSAATICVCNDDSDNEYDFDEFTTEEDAELQELLNVIHENFRANKHQ